MMILEETKTYSLVQILVSAIMPQMLIEYFFFFFEANFNFSSRNVCRRTIIVGYLKETSLTGLFFAQIIEKIAAFS